MYKTLFQTFFKIGAFTLGGGYAMIPIIESEVVDKHQWIEKDEFLDLIAIAQSCPGVFAINISTFVGYKLKGRWGAFCTSLGAALPSFLIILGIAMFFHQFMHVGWIAAMFRGIRPAVVALIAVPTFNLAKRARFNQSGQLLDSHWLCPAHLGHACEPHLDNYCGRSGRVCVWQSVEVAFPSFLG